MQHTGLRKTTRSRNTILDGGDGPPRTPNIIHNQRGSATQLIICRELDELWPGNQLRLFAR